MMSTSVLFGIILIAFSASLLRWFDDITTSEICLYILACELVSAVSITNHFAVTDGQFVLDVGGFFLNLIYFSIQLLFCYDILSSFFFSILILALMLCFYFLAEYFEYDASAANIVILSALFSQLALLFFTSFDLFLMIFFWEAISIVSFLLVQHWNHRLASYKAGLKVFFISQIGDLPLLMFLFLMFNRFQTTNLFEILTVAPLFLFEFVFMFFIYINFVYLACCLLFFAVFLKAAQFFFYPWLLDAMEAPVPISAQLHSSTLVIIGFYLFYRFQVFFFLSSAFSFISMWLGVFTVIGASILAFYQTDGKRLLACSTASQLGYVVVALSLGLYEEGLALLMFCCINKAFTFVWFGVLMHRASGLSDFRLLTSTNSKFWLAHAGIVTAISNFTIIPGAFSWHVKGLFILSQTPLQPVGAFIGLELLQLTWFFSSLYLITLYVILFFKQAQGPKITNTYSSVLFLKSFLFFKKTLAPISISFYFLTLLIVISIVTPFFTNHVLMSDLTVFTYTLIGFFSYY